MALLKVWPYPKAILFGVRNEIMRNTELWNCSFGLHLQESPLNAEKVEYWETEICLCHSFISMLSHLIPVRAARYGAVYVSANIIALKLLFVPTLSLCSCSYDQQSLSSFNFLLLIKAMYFRHSLLWSAYKSGHMIKKVD